MKIAFRQEGVASGILLVVFCSFFAEQRMLMLWQVEHPNAIDVQVQCQGTWAGICHNEVVGGAGGGTP